MRCFRLRTRPSRGYALLIVMIVILTSTAMATVHQRHLSAALRIEQARIRSENQVNGSLSVLATAMVPLDAAFPTTSPAEYSYLHTVNSVETMYRVTYLDIGGGRWTVTAEPDLGALTLPTLPSKF